ncbi:hypothetical protein GGX14DRAFT_165686 [Mycena pura]|uniref:Uncharacterized protein n=1 Tax=Mycena pura TaxID=153505 RepID=A0AAD7E1K4_9AGAR|nr:hypothetical protein GGX14DRAFT_165686 [Mycena pura]
MVRHQLFRAACLSSAIAECFRVLYAISSRKLHTHWHRRCDPPPPVQWRGDAVFCYYHRCLSRTRRDEGSNFPQSHMNGWNMKIGLLSVLEAPKTLIITMEKPGGGDSPHSLRHSA